jgi:uncharacterized protein (DUF2252 family)
LTLNCETYSEPSHSISSLIAEGKALRKSVGRSVHGSWQPGSDRPDPIDVLEASNVGRLKDFIPVRHARMSRSAFTFLRGIPSLMAYDLGILTPNTGIRVQACGDCHLENFGIFATPERRVVFDINDFDETLPAPWEWDLKRLAVSIHVAGRVKGLSEKQCAKSVIGAVRAYRRYMWSCTDLTALEIWYSRVDATKVLEQTRNIELRRSKLPDTAPEDTHEVIAERVTEGNGLGTRILDKPPNLFHPPSNAEVIVDARQVFASYRESIRDHIRILFESYRLTDLAIKVVGLGSVGTRCAVALLIANEKDALVLQIKEARPSILEPYAGASQYANNGERVVAGQLLMQVASDIFLGWSDSKDGHHFYVRQLWDMKRGVDISAMNEPELRRYSAICGQVLAVAHARSRKSAQIAGYLGKSSTFDHAIVAFARSYADQVESDFALFQAAVSSGRISTEEDELRVHE